MKKLSNHLIEVDDKMRFFAKAAHTLLTDIIYYSNKGKKKRRKIDKKLTELMTYMEKIDSLGYQLKFDICVKKEVINSIGSKNYKTEKGGKR